MTFIPDTWRQLYGANSILKGNLESAVRQLTIEQRIIDVFQNDENGKNDEHNDHHDHDDNNDDQTTNEKCEVKQELDSLGNGDDYNNHIKEHV